MLRRHPNTDQQMTPEQNRQKWEVRRSYLMVARTMRRRASPSAQGRTKCEALIHSAASVTWPASGFILARRLSIAAETFSGNV